MMKAFHFIQRNSLKLIGIAALIIGTIYTAPLKVILLYQPECPKELR